MKQIIKKLKTIYWRVLAVLAKYYYCNPSKEMKVVGVTGTNGKTTTTTLLYKVATALGYKTGLIGTVENIIDGEVRVSTHTTPDSVSLTRLLSEMRDKGCEYVFMEVSSHSLEQKRVSQTTFAGAVFTNLTHDHLDYHKSLENYFQAKKKLFRMLPKKSFALSNADDERGKDMVEGIKAEPSLYGFYGEADYKGKISEMDFNGLELEFNGQKVNSKLLGNFNAYNLLSVWSTCDLLGFDMSKVKSVLETIEPPRGRFEHFMSPSGVLVIVDYAHTPDALDKVLTVANEIKGGGKLISVFGCGGDRDPMKRTKMGRIGAAMSDVPIFTSDNPRGEDPSQIIRDMMLDLMPDQIAKVQIVQDRREAIKTAMKMAQKGDVILCAGKGHETYQEIKGEKQHFSDREEFEKLF